MVAQQAHGNRGSNDVSHSRHAANGRDRNLIERERLFCVQRNTDCHPIEPESRCLQEDVRRDNRRETLENRGLTLDHVSFVRYH